MDIDTRTIPLFNEEESCIPTLSERISKATASVLNLIEQSYPIVILFSGGKDSSAVAALVLSAAKIASAHGKKPTIIVMNGDTLIENPEVRRLCDVEIMKMRDYARGAGFNLITRIVQPSLLSTFQVKVLVGRGLPSWPGGNSDCSSELKIHNSRVERRRLAKQFEAKGFKEPISLIGTRFDESQRRALNMKARGERSDEPVRNSSGELVLSPIAHWSADDVFEYLGHLSSKTLEAYSDMRDVLRIYAHSGGTNCAVVSYDILEGGDKKRRGGCGARTGCWACQMVEDKSLKTLVDFDDEYAYARPLVNFSELIRRKRYDWSTRNWVGRTIKQGFVAIEPDSYSPQWTRALTRMLLTIDHDERLRASRAGERPRFETMPLSMKVAVDFLQNLNGMAPPFSVWADVRDIEERGLRYEVPIVDTTPPTPMPEPKFLYVGDEWNVDPHWTMGALRDDYVEAMTELSPCIPGLKTLKSGREVWDLPTDKGFSVDPEVASFIENEFQDEILRIHDNWAHDPRGITAGYKWYIGLGTPTLDHSLIAIYDEIGRRTEWKHKHGLTLVKDPTEIYAKAIRFADLPESARKAWAGKASNSGAQVDLESMIANVG